MQKNTLLVIAGILMVIASIASLFLGMFLVNAYISSTVSRYYVWYNALTAGIMNLAAFPIGLISGALMLLRKGVSLAMILSIAVLIIGLATPLIFEFAGYVWELGLLYALPMIVFPIAGLVVITLSRIKAMKFRTNKFYVCRG